MEVMIHLTSHCKWVRDFDSQPSLILALATDLRVKSSREHGRAGGGRDPAGEFKIGLLGMGLTDYNRDRLIESRQG